MKAFRVFVLAVVAGVCALQAQDSNASISGLVLDSSGSAVPGARVVARNVQTGLERQAASAESGNYTLPLLPVGAYEVSVEKDGFKKSVQSGITLQIDQRARVDFQLQIGAASESIQVTGEMPLTQTDTSTVGSVIDNQKVVEMPLNGRQFYSLALLVPGVAPPAQGSILSFRGGFNVAGSSELYNNFSLNGLANNNQLLSAPAFRPSVDAIQEFKILTGVFPAEYGRNSGSQVVVTTKSGTNTLHGSAFEFLRNQVTDARNYFTPAGSAIPAFKQNQFGGTLGGPIRKNKTFYFASYEGSRSNQQVTALATVPTTPMLSGDFSGITTVITDPYTRTPLPGNRIPQSLISAPGQFLARLYPVPTFATAATRIPNNNYVFNQPQIGKLNLGSLRLDHTIGEKDTINGSYNDFQDSQLTQNNTVCGSRVVPGFDCTVDLLARLYGLSETHIFSPNFINEVRIGVSQFANPRTTNDQDIKFIEQFRIPGTRFDGPPYPGVPQTTINGFATLGEPANFPQRRVDRTYQLADHLTLVRGQHTFKTGMDILRFQTNGTIVGNGRGTYTFNVPPTGSDAPYGGYPLASLLMGVPIITTRSPYSPRYYPRTGSYALYFQDDWKFSPRLTFNAGMRWEYHIPIFDARNTLSNFNPATGSIDVAGTAGVPRAIWDPNKTNFMPRFGFSYQPFRNNSKTVIRGGYGIFFNAPALNVVSSGAQQNNAPFVSAQTFNASRAVPLTFADPFPAAAAGAGSLTLSAVQRRLPDAYSQQWSLNIQQQITSTTVLEVGYQGSKGTHLPLLFNLNQPPPGPGNAQVKQAQRPYPQFGNITWLTARGDSSFNGLILKVEQRASKGLSFLLAYMHGKSIDNTAGTPFNVTPSRGQAMDPTNLAREKGLSGFDIRNRLVISTVYQLPFGKGRQFQAGNRFVDAVIGGWETSNIITFQSGRPFSVLLSRDNANVLASVDRPNVVGNPYLAGPVAANPTCNAPSQVGTPSFWINPCAFVAAPAGTFGNGGRNNLIAPPLKSMDIVVSRVVKVTESFSAQIRVEAFNSFNHPNFDAPAQTLDGAGFASLLTAAQARQLQFGLKLRF